jgi:hypothetical protein
VARDASAFAADMPSPPPEVHPPTDVAANSVETALAHPAAAREAVGHVGAASAVTLLGIRRRLTQPQQAACIALAAGVATAAVLLLRLRRT